MHIHGKCHCGNIVIDLDWPDGALEIPARARGCSFCTQHGAVWTAHPDAKLTVAVNDAAHVSKYAFGTRTTAFHVCSQCGGVPLATCEIDGCLYAVANVNTFENIEPSMLRKTAANFEGENLEKRLARRKHNWIAHVRVMENGA